MRKFKLLKFYPTLPSGVEINDVVEQHYFQGLTFYKKDKDVVDHFLIKQEINDDLINYINLRKNEVENFPEFWEEIFE